MDNSKELHRSVRDVLVNLGASLAAAVIIGLVGLKSSGSSSTNAIVIMVVAFILVLGVLTFISWLLGRVPVSPLHSRQGRRLLQQYLVNQKREVLAALVSGFTGLHVRDVVATDGLFISPPWARYSGQHESGDMIEETVHSIMQGERILILGEAGQGKTIVMKRLLSVLTDRCIADLSNRTAPIPIYVPLRELAFARSDGRHQLWEYLMKHDFPFSYEEFLRLTRTSRLVFLLDGFDEITGELGQQHINERVASDIFRVPSVLTCRTNFYELYLSVSVIHENYPTSLVLLPLTLNEAEQEYIRHFCAKQQDHDPHHNSTPPQLIIDTIIASHELWDLAQRPLLLSMMLEIFTDPRELQRTHWSLSMLYERYTERWLQTEATKPDSVLRWPDKATLVELVAWAIYQKGSLSATPLEMYETASVTRNELASILLPDSHRLHPLTLSQIVDDVSLRTFLVGNYRDQYYFVHKSFYEFFVAVHIMTGLRQHEASSGAASTLLGQLIRVDVAVFIKDMLSSHYMADADKGTITENLIRVYNQNPGSAATALIARQQASHYLAFTATPAAEAFLLDTYGQEPDKWVQRGMMVGLAISCHRRDVLERYIAALHADQEADSINIAYHLVYYGDQPLEEGFKDLGGSKCDGTVKAILQHLRSNGYRDGWAIDLYTLRRLIETRGAAILSQRSSSDIQRLQGFLAAKHTGQTGSFEQERQLLLDVMSSVKVA